MYKKVELIFLLALLVGLVLLSGNLEEKVSSEQVNERKGRIIIDPGHGGNDPGKVGVNNALEKDINLQIARQVKECLEKRGYEVTMTRDKDEMLCEESSANKKVEDMKKRVELINKDAPDVVVSIHQNSYQEESIRGAQVFYYAHSEEGKKAAEIMQGALLEIDADNTREAKANDTYYLLKRTEVPTIIVECGFLSNQEEAARLVDEEYQEELAEAIAKGTETYLASKIIGK